MDILERIRFLELNFKTNATDRFVGNLELHFESKKWTSQDPVDLGRKLKIA